MIVIKPTIIVRPEINSANKKCDNNIENSNVSNVSQRKCIGKSNPQIYDIMKQFSERLQRLSESIK